MKMALQRDKDFKLPNAHANCEMFLLFAMLSVVILVASLCFE